MCLINNQVWLITQVYAVSVKISMLSIVKLQFLPIILAMCMILFKDTWFAHLQQQCILLLLHDTYDCIRTISEFGELNLIHQYFTQPNPVNNLLIQFQKKLCSHILP